MTQELIDLRNSIVEGRYADALAIVDDIESMSKQAILRKIQSFLIRLMVHLIKNQVERRLTNSWAASIENSVVEIQELNIKENQTSYYIKQDEWEPFLEKAIELAIRPASLEVLNGRQSRAQLSEMLDKPQLILTATGLLALTYSHAAKELPAVIDESLALLPGGEEWNADN